VRFDPRDFAYLRGKAEGGLAVLSGCFTSVGLQVATRAVAERTSGRAHESAVAADEFVRGRLGVALVIVAVAGAVYWALRRMHRPADDELA